MQNPNGDTYYHTPSLRMLLANLALMQNFLKGENILGVTWSLPPEVQMYVLLPFLFFFLKQQNKLWPLILLWVFFAVGWKMEYAQGGISICAPYFLPGVMAYILFPRVRPRLPAFLFPVFIACLFFVFMLHPGFPHGWRLTLALGLGIPFFHQIRTEWLKTICHHLAKYSYGIYICHLFFISLGINYLAHHNLTIRLTAVLLPLAITAVLLYHLFEKPMIELGARLAHRFERPVATA
jgi:peptidoglycan/LPS O-acetylase OafA/YrhL